MSKHVKMQRAVRPFAALLVAGCALTPPADKDSASPPGLETTRSALASDQTFAIPPVVQMLNDNFGSASDPKFTQNKAQTGFSVFWFLNPTSNTTTPDLAVPGASVLCTSDGITYNGCAPSNVNDYCYCNVTGLQANTAYTYKVILPGGTDFSQTIRTALPRGATDAFNFVFYSDTHGEIGDDEAHQKATMGAIAHYEHPAFMLFGGDMGTFGGTAKVNSAFSGTGLGGGWQEFVGYNSFANTSGTQDGSNFTRNWMHSLALDQAGWGTDTPVYSKFPVMFAVGNHDWWNTCDESGCPTYPYEHGATMPEFLKVTSGDHAFTGDGNGRAADSVSNYHYYGWRNRYYAFDYGNSRFIVLDTGLHNRMDIGGHWSTYGGGCGVAASCDLTYDGIQMKFAHDALDNAKQYHPEIKHKFIIMHTAPYDQKGDTEELVDNGTYQQDDDDTAYGYKPAWHKYRKNFVTDLAEDYGVDAILSGHVHDYQRRTHHHVKYITCAGAGGFDESVPDPSHSEIPYDSVNDDPRNESAAFLGGGYCVISVSGSGVSYTRKNTFTTTPLGCKKGCGDFVRQDPPRVMDTSVVGLMAPSNLTAILQNDNTVKLSWHNANDNAVSYSMLRWVDGIQLAEVAITPGGTTADPTFVDNFPFASHRWGFAVRAHQAPNLFTDFTPTKYVNFGPCKYNTAISALNYDVANNWISVAASNSYSCPGVTATGYRVERQLKGFFDPDGSQTEWEPIIPNCATPTAGCKDTNVPWAYYGIQYRIAALLDSGDTEYSPVSNLADTSGASVRPAQISTTPASRTSAVLEWQFPQTYTGYIAVERRSCTTNLWSDYQAPTAYAPWTDDTASQSTWVPTADSCSTACDDSYRVAYINSADGPNGPRYYSNVVTPVGTACLGVATIQGAASTFGKSIDITVTAFTPNSGGMAADSYAFYRRPSNSSADWEYLKTIKGALPITYEDGEVHPYAPFDYAVAGRNSTLPGKTTFGAAGDVSATLTGLTRQPGHCATPIYLPMTAPSGSMTAELGDSVLTDTRLMCAGVSGAKILYYQFSLSTTENVYFDTFGSAFDTVMGILVPGGVGHDGCNSNQLIAGCNDDSGCYATTNVPGATYSSRVSHTLTAGTYLVYVKPYNGGVTSGRIQLNWSHSGSSFANPIMMTSGVLYSGSTVTGSSHANGSCSGTSGADDVVYGMMLCPGARTISASTCYAGTNFDTLLYLRPDASSAADIACNDDSVCAYSPVNRASSITTTTPTDSFGGMNYLIVDTYSATGSFSVQATF
jgi:hypothetical protein